MIEFKMVCLKNTYAQHFKKDLSTLLKKNTD